jgi:hypothetical protein
MHTSKDNRVFKYSLKFPTLAQPYGELKEKVVVTRTTTPNINSLHLMSTTQGRKTN